MIIIDVTQTQTVQYKGPYHLYLDRDISDIDTIQLRNQLTALLCPLSMAATPTSNPVKRRLSSARNFTRS